MNNRTALSAFLSVLVTAASAAIALVALDRASGVTRTARGCCETEFIDGTFLGLLWVLLPVVAVAAYWSWRTALLAVVGLTLPQWLAMNEVMDRYSASGWGDGLEVLGYLGPVLMAALALVAVLAGGLVARRREAQDQ